MFISTLLLTLALPSLLLAQVVETPSSLVECLPSRIFFSGGVAPYIISVLPGGESGATPLAILPTQDAAGSVTWVVNQPAGTALTFGIRDGEGITNFSEQVTVQAGVDSSCLSATATIPVATSPTLTDLITAPSSSSEPADTSSSSSGGRNSSTPFISSLFEAVFPTGSGNTSAPLISGSSISSAATASSSATKASETSSSASPDSRAAETSPGANGGTTGASSRSQVSLSFVGLVAAVAVVFASS